jgi:hypothetical protein
MINPNHDPLTDPINISIYELNLSNPKNQSPSPRQTQNDSWQKIKIHIEDLLNREVPDFSAHKKKTPIKIPQEINSTENFNGGTARFCSKSEFLGNRNFTENVTSSCAKQESEKNGNLNETLSIGRVSEIDRRGLGRESMADTWERLGVLGIGGKFNQKTKKQKLTLRKLNSMRVDRLYNFIDAKEVQINYEIAKNLRERQILRSDQSIDVEMLFKEKNRIRDHRNSVVHGMKKHDPSAVDWNGYSMYSARNSQRARVTGKVTGDSNKLEKSSKFKPKRVTIDDASHKGTTPDYFRGKIDTKSTESSTLNPVLTQKKFNPNRSIEKISPFKGSKESKGPYLSPGRITPLSPVPMTKRGSFCQRNSKIIPVIQLQQLKQSLIHEKPAKTKFPNRPTHPKPSPNKNNKNSLNSSIASLETSPANPKPKSRISAQRVNIQFGSGIIPAELLARKDFTQFYQFHLIDDLENIFNLFSIG